mmetsp:Transcript_4396/g.14990  ORF Transcript_4396/g.14990 Transcript_4396/m.14990 type:complete len:88 (-) Transcript_4396:318-581(-)
MIFTNLQSHVRTMLANSLPPEIVSLSLFLGAILIRRRDFFGIDTVDLLAALRDARLWTFSTFLMARCKTHSKYLSSKEPLEGTTTET